MKRFRHILRFAILAYLVLLTTNINAQNEGFQASSITTATSHEDSLAKSLSDMEVSLLTCGPGNEVYSLFGHTAIRISQPSRGMDIVVNYGMFSFKQDYFIARFVLGLTDYKMGIQSFDDFKAEYEYEQRWVLEQALNLTIKERIALIRAINENYKPENITYRYNFFYNNCTTKARDIIEENIDGKIEYGWKQVSGESYRELCHSKTSDHRWAQMGNDLLLGIKADMPTTSREQQFLPEHLEGDFNNAIIIDNNNSKRKLVKHEEYIIPKDIVVSQNANNMPTPRSVAVMIAIIIIGISIVEYLWSKNWWMTDAILMPLIGLAGIILLVMVFSKHPTVNINLQILILNPMALLMTIPMIRKQRKGIPTWWHKAYIYCLFVGILCGLIQDYAEGIRILALSLLVRYMIVVFNLKKLSISDKRQ